MRKLFLLFIVAVSVSLNAQSKSMAFKAGYYFPSNLKSGVIFGLDYGFRVDESVHILLASDFYYKSISEDEISGEAEKLGVNITEGQHLSKWLGWHLPLTLKARVDFRIAQENVKPFATAGFGYGFTNISYDKYLTDKTQPFAESLSYSGFVWQLGGGIMFGLGSRSHLVIEALYNGASFDKDITATKFTTLNSSGLIMRAGIDFMISSY